MSAERGFSRTEAMTVAASRLLRDGAVCFVGIGLPSTAANLARLTHAPEVVLIYESGTIGARPQVLPLSIGDGELSTSADTVVSTPEIFRYWLQGGRIDVGFLGAAQIDRFANINTTTIGSYERPKVRLPGAGGAPEIAGMAGEVFIVVEQTPRTFVERLEFITSTGFLGGADARKRSGLRGKGPSAVITDLGILTPEEATKELTLTSIHPGVTVEQARAATGWPLKVSDVLQTTRAPEAGELAALRELLRRTAEKHGRGEAAHG